jgi:hypothetical protein
VERLLADDRRTWCSASSPAAPPPSCPRPHPGWDWRKSRRWPRCSSPAARTSRRRTPSASTSPGSREGASSGRRGPRAWRDSSSPTWWAIRWTSSARGPTVADPPRPALAVFARQELLDRLPTAVRARLEAGARGELPETPKPGSAEVDGVRTCSWTNRIALLAAAESARPGVPDLVLSSTLTGGAREVGAVVAAPWPGAPREPEPVPPPACLWRAADDRHPPWRRRGRA